MDAVFQTLPELYAWFAARRDELFRAAGVGTVSDGVVAQRLQCSRESVAGWRRAHGVSAPGTSTHTGRPKNTARDVEIRQRRAAGESSAQLAVAYGLTTIRIDQITRKAA